jgi:hypothetical protein
MASSRIIQYEDGINVDTNPIFNPLIVRQDLNSYKLLPMNYKSTSMQIIV